MTREEAIKELKTSNARYAELVIDICATNGGIVYPKEKVIVSILETQDRYDFSDIYTCFDSIRDFKKHSVFGEKEARKYLSNYYFGDIHSINYVK